MKIDNPDVNGIYHCWHVCKTCGKAWTHSQGDFEDLKRHQHIVESIDNYLTIPAYIKRISIEGGKLV